MCNFPGLSPEHGDEPCRCQIRDGSGAVEKTRTSTEFPPQRPQRCASTNSATTACRGCAYQIRGIISSMMAPKIPSPEGSPAAEIEWRTSAAPVAYDDAVAAMEERISAIRAGAAPELVWLLEHPPLY